MKSLLLSLTSLLLAATATSSPNTFPPTPTTTSTATTPTPLLPPAQFNLRILSPASRQILGYLILPSTPTSGSIPKTQLSPSIPGLAVFYFNRKSPTGLGWISNGPVFFAPDWYVLSYRPNTTSSTPKPNHSPGNGYKRSTVYLDNLSNNPLYPNTGFDPVIVHAVRLGPGVEGDGKVYLAGQTNNLAGEEVVTDPVVWEWDEGDKTLGVATAWSKRSVLIELVPVRGPHNGPYISQRDDDERKGKVAAKTAGLLGRRDVGETEAEEGRKGKVAAKVAVIGIEERDECRKGKYC